jgi:hypothetical protein
VVRDDCAYFRLVVSRARDGKAPRKTPRKKPSRGRR